MAHVASWKKDEIKEIKKLIDEFPVIGVVNVGAVPGKQMQKIRASIRGENAQIRMSRLRLMKRALKGSSKEGLENLSDNLTGQAGLLFSKSNPFKIYKVLEKNRTRAPAKPNSLATSDIAVKKGDTPFPPGPILSELQLAGIPAAIQSGKVVIKQDKVLVRAGERITSPVSNALSRLEIEPVEIKLDLLAAYEEGTIYTPDILGVDSQKIASDFSLAHKQALNLSVNSGYPTNKTAQLLISRAEAEARNLAINAGIFEKEVMNAILASAYSKARVLESLTK
jgi:large subunit ribosomal protein L10